MSFLYSVYWRLFLYADNLCKQFGSRSRPTEGRSWSGSKLFYTLIVFLKEHFEKKADFEKNHHTHYTCMRSYLVELKDWILVWAFSRVPPLCGRAAKALAIPCDRAPETLAGAYLYAHTLACEQWRLWRDCAFAQARLSICRSYLR